MGIGDQFKPRRLEIRDDGLWENAFGKVTEIKWVNVARIRGINLDKIAFDEIFIAFENDSQIISVGELEKAFGQVEEVARSLFAGIPPGWMSDLLQSGDREILLWEKNEQDSSV